MKLIFGVGVNDSGYATRRVAIVDGVQKTLWECPVYSVWKSMLRRCYSSRWLLHRPSYTGSSVCDEWHLFSNFAAWMSRNDFHGMDLDKDLLVPGNKVYRPESCAFITGSLNVFITESRLNRGEWPTGVHFSPSRNKFIAQVNNPFTRKRQWLGEFSCQDAAHSAWKSAKHQLACRYADMQSDPRVAQALRTRYLPGTEHK